MTLHIPTQNILKVEQRTCMHIIVRTLKKNCLERDIISHVTRTALIVSIGGSTKDCHTFKSYKPVPNKE